MGDVLFSFFGPAPLTGATVVAPTGYLYQIGRWVDQLPQQMRCIVAIFFVPRCLHPIHLKVKNTF